MAVCDDALKTTLFTAPLDAELLISKSTHVEFALLSVIIVMEFVEPSITAFPPSPGELENPCILTLASVDVDNPAVTE